MLPLVQQIQRQRIRLVIDSKPNVLPLQHPQYTWIRIIQVSWEFPGVEF